MMKIKLRANVLIIIGLMAAIFPFIVLSFFNHPQNDDYVAAAGTKAVGFVNNNIRAYYIWSARYFATIVVSGFLNPLLLGSMFIYKLTAAVTISFLFYSLDFFIRELTSLSIDRRDALLISLALLALYLLQVPAIAESVYWMCGSICYQYSIIFLLLEFGYMIRLSRTVPSRITLLQKALVALLILVTAGTNEISMILQSEILALLVLFSIMAKDSKKTTDGHWIVFFVISAIAAAIVIFAPGTQVRNSYGPHNFWPSVQSSFLDGLKYVYLWCTTTPLVPLAALFMDFMVRQTKFTLPFTIHPALSISLFLLTYFGMLFPSFYNASKLEPHTVSLNYFFFLFGLMVNICVLVRHLADRSNGKLPNLNTYAKAIVWATAFVLFIVPDSNLKTAYSDILSGRAYRFDAALNSRYEIIRECRSFVCDVPPILERPKTISFFEDAVDEKKDSAFFLQYKDNGYAYYFGKRRIRLSESPPMGSSDAAR